MTKRFLDILLRGLLVLAAYYNFLGFMWTGGSSGAAATYAVYLASPWIAMAIGAFLPNKMLGRNSGRFLFGPIALIAAARIAHQIVGDLTLANGPDYGPAMIRVGFIALLALVGAKALLVNRDSSSSISGHQP